MEDFDGNNIGLAMLESVVNRYRYAGPWVTWLHKDHRGQGHALDIDMIIFRFGFDFLNLHKIFTEVLSTNLPSLKQIEREVSWLEREGVFKHEILVNGKWVDLHRFAIFEYHEGWKNYWM